MEPSGTNPATPRAADVRLRQLAQWQGRRFHRAFWRVLLASGLAAVFLLLILRSTAEDPHANIVQSRSALKALQPAPVPDAENAALDYRMAFKAFVSYSKMTGNRARAANGKALDPIEMLNGDSAELEQPQVQAYLSANAAAFTLLEAAVQKPHCDWKIDYADRFFAATDHLTAMRQAARLLLVRARVRAHGGDHAGAASDLSAARIVAAHAGGDHFLLDSLVCNSIHAMNSAALQWIVLYDTPLRPDELKGYRAALAPIADPQKESIRTFETEGALGLNMLDWAALQDPRTLMLLGGKARPETEYSTYRLVYGGDRKTYVGVFDEVLATLKRGELLKDEMELLRRNCKGAAPLTMIFVPALGRSQMAFLRSADTLRCADTALALLMFRARHGRDAKTLDELVPEFLPAVPSDFLNRLPLRKREDAQELKIVHRPDPLIIPVGTIRVYSLGVNGVDESGENTWFPLRAGQAAVGDDPVFIIPPPKGK